MVTTVLTAIFIFYIVIISFYDKTHIIQAKMIVGFLNKPLNGLNCI